MVKSVGIIAATMAASVAFAGMGSLVTSFPNAGKSTHYGLAADLTYLYSFHQDLAGGYPVVVLRRANGSFVRSMAVPLPPLEKSYVRGMGYEGDGSLGEGYLHLNNYGYRYVAKVRIATGKLAASWAWSGGDNRYGLCAENDKTRIGTLRGFYQSYLGGTWWHSNRQGSLMSSWRAPTANYAYDLAWDYRNNFIWYANSSTNWVFGMTTAGSIRESWPLKAGVRYPYGIAYYANRLYVSTSGGNPDEYVWVYDCPLSTVDVEPASLGRVKALFE
jgi:hypothetical protein